jgi:hypothetical protein
MPISGAVLNVLKAVTWKRAATAGRPASFIGRIGFLQPWGIFDSHVAIVRSCKVAFSW